MNPKTAYCGLDCDSCPIHLATLETDPAAKIQMRVQIAEELSRIYGTKPRPDFITDCDGCKEPDGRLFHGCLNCKIRNCAIMKNMINCAYCREFPCSNLESHYKYDPASRDRLEEIRKGIGRHEVN